MPAPVHYRVEIANRHEHRFAVELRIARPAAEQVVSLPVWIPGSYLVREFARHLNGLAATQSGKPCPIRQLDKCSWAIAADPRRALVLRYEMRAFDRSVRAAWLDAERGFFNGTSLLLRVHGREDTPHTLTIKAPTDAPSWQLATAMTPQRVDARGFGDYVADGYDELVDHPAELGTFWAGDFEAAGVPHRFVVAGAPASFDGARLLRDAQRICETAIRFWHDGGKPPFDKYLFILNAVGDGYGGLEHRASSALICNRADLPRMGASVNAAEPGDGYVTLLGLISHEYFHAWNVKRLRPVEFTRYDYTRENHTELLWFFEGFTSYYDDLLLRRAGLIDDAAYLKILTRSVNQVLQAPGRHVQSVAQASFDAWQRYYRPDENTPNTTISYYSKGALVALCLDLRLRAEGKTTLDHVMRALWQRCAAGPLREDDVMQALSELGERSWQREITDWVHGTGELPLQALLETHGVTIQHDPAPLAQALGLRVNEDHGVTIQLVLDGSPAAAAGMAAGDEWLGIEVVPGAPATRKTRQKNSPTAAAWRIKRLDEVPLHAGGAREITALVARDQRLLRLVLTLPEDVTTWRLVPGKDGAGTPVWPGQ